MLKVDFKYQCNNVDFPYSVKSSIGEEVLHPTTVAVLYYCMITGVNQIKDANDVDELMLRISFVRSMGTKIFTDTESGQNVFEPTYIDISRHIGLSVECEYVALRQFINKYVTDTIDSFRNKTIEEKNVLPYENFFEIRDSSLKEYLGFKETSQETTQEKQEQKENSGDDSSAAENTVQEDSEVIVAENMDTLGDKIREQLQGKIEEEMEVDRRKNILKKVTPSTVEPNAKKSRAKKSDTTKATGSKTKKKTAKAGSKSKKK